LAKKNVIKNIGKGIEGANTLLQLVTAVTASVAVFAEPIGEKIESHNEKQRLLVKVPETYLKDYPKTLEQAITNIEEVGLRPDPSPVLVKDANIKYKDCFDNQVVSSHPSQNKKVEPGTRVHLKYVTRDVIDESIRLFTEYEENKLTKYELKNNKKFISGILKKTVTKNKV